MDQISEKKQQTGHKIDFTKGGKKGRIIVRNLVFDIKANHLKALFSKFGQIDDINIPLNPANNSAKGFAFIEFNNKNSALQAISELNGKLFKGRQIILDSAIAKENYSSARPTNQKIEHEENEENYENGVKQEVEEDEEQEVEDEVEEEVEEIEGEEEEKVEEEVEEEIVEPETKKQKIKREEDLTQTLFVRNLPLDTSETQLVEFFEKFGEVNFAKLVLNRETKEAKGTAFIKFKSPETAQEVLKKSSQLERMFKQQQYKRDNSKSDELELLGGEFELQGRRIYIFEAINKQEAHDMSQKETKTTVKPTKDIRQVKHLKQLIPYDANGKRNLKLSILGMFEAEEAMPLKEQQKREEHVRVKLQKLKNPNFFVSDKRIAMKNLPKALGLEEVLTDMAKEALSWAQTYVPERTKILDKVWVSKDRDIMALKTEEAPNTGLAFIEFHEAEHAITFMSYVHKNREDVLKRFNNRLPIIEFAIEDIRKIQKIEKRRELQKEFQKEKNTQRLKDNGGQETRSQKKNKVNLTNKLLIEGIMKGKDCESVENIQKIQSLWGELKSRGMKQRLKQRIEKRVNINLGPEQPRVVQPKQVKKVVKAESKSAAQIKQQEDRQSQHKKMEAHFEGIMQDIKSKVLKKRHAKQEAQEHDDVDDMAEKRIAQLQKKVKWFS